MSSEAHDRRDERFAFGENWTKFLRLLTDERISDAERSLEEMLGTSTLEGARFLDAGSGSGLFSLAARKLGASVHSFDYDSASVACTMELKRRFFPDDSAWIIEQGSVLDRAYMEGLGRFDVVYSWGVVHHTGNMWSALDNVLSAVAGGGAAFVAIYNDQGWISRYWRLVKRTYVRFPPLRWPIKVAHAPYLVGAPMFLRWVTGRLRPDRGMSYLRDLSDWVGGYPFETAKPEQVVDFCVRRGFAMRKLRTVGARQGCNEFVFESRSGERE